MYATIFSKENIRSPCLFVFSEKIEYGNQKKMVNAITNKSNLIPPGHFEISKSQESFQLIVLPDIRYNLLTYLLMEYRLIKY